MLSTDEARALITTSLSDEDLAAVIAREEAWLARRIGPLQGERTETFATVSGDEILRLARPTSSATVEDEAGSITDLDLQGWSDVVLDADGSRGWSGDAQVTYEPSDAEEVKRALITLVRLTIGESAHAAQGAGGYTVATDVDAQDRRRYRTWRALVRPREATTMRIRGSSGAGVLHAVSVVASGS